MSKNILQISNNQYVRQLQQIKYVLQKSLCSEHTSKHHCREHKRTGSSCNKVTCTRAKIFCKSVQKSASVNMSNGCTRLKHLSQISQRCHLHAGSYSYVGCMLQSSHEKKMTAKKDTFMPPAHAFTSLVHTFMSSVHTFVSIAQMFVCRRQSTLGKYIQQETTYTMIIYL